MALRQQIAEAFNGRKMSLYERLECVTLLETIELTNRALTMAEQTIGIRLRLANIYARLDRKRDLMDGPNLGSE